MFGGTDWKLSVLGERLRSQNVAKKDGSGRGCRSLFGRRRYLLRGTISLKRTLKKEKSIERTNKAGENKKISRYCLFFSIETIDKYKKKWYNE